jgi:GR25 family glycosyltransferase involved in LPS biosynthesis
MDINELSTNNLIKEDNIGHINTKQIIDNLHNSKKNKTLISSNVFIPTPDNIKIKFSEKNISTLKDNDTLEESLAENEDNKPIITKTKSNEPTNKTHYVNQINYVNKNIEKKENITHKIIKVLKKYKVKNISINNNKESSINKRVKKIYVINLLEDVYKRNYIITLMKKYGINFNLIVVERVSNELCKELCKNGLTRGELGCTLSHLWCLYNSINNKDENMIIFEDDIIMHKDFTNYFNHIYDTNPNLDFLLLGAHDLNFSKNNYKRVKNNLYVPDINTTNLYGAHANYYSLTGARRIFYLRITNLSFFDKEYMLLFNKFPNSYVVYPNMVVANVSDSTLNHTREMFSKMEHDYYNRCFINFNFKDYNFLYINLLKNLNYIDPNQDDYDKVTERYLYNTFHDFDKIEEIKSRLNNDFFTVDDIINIISHR